MRRRTASALELAHTDEIAARFSNVALGGSMENCLSDYSASNMYLFRREHSYRYLEGAFPGVCGVTYDGMAHLLPLVSLESVPPTVLGNWLRQHECACFYPVSREQLSRLDPGHFVAQTNRDDADYLYQARNFRIYQGDKLGKKRNQVNQLLKKVYITARPYQEGLMDEALAVHLEWMHSREKVAGEADDLPCRDALSHAEALHLEGFVYFVADEPIGFILAEEIRSEVFVIRFAKGVDRFPGIYPFMFQHFCNAAERPVSWLNFEQDMGIEGLRRNKLSYAPHSLLPKYRLFPK